MAYSILRRVIHRSTGVFKSRLISSKSGSEEAPWLILPPSFEGNNMYYKFYSLTEQKVFSIKKSFQSEAPAPDDDAEFVGSSHGWLVLLNRRIDDLFLWNPRSRRHIKLPWIQLDAYDLETNDRAGKVILTSPPDEHGCLAAIIYGPGNRLAVCTPGESKYCRRIENPFEECEIVGPCRRWAKVFEDVVFCSRGRILNCITPFELNLLDFDPRFLCELYYWDVVGETVQPHEALTSLYISEVKAIGEKTRRWAEENYNLLENCVQIPHLVYAKAEGEEEECLYVVMRFVALLGTDGTYVDPLPQCPAFGLKGYFPCETVGFVVVKVDYDEFCIEVVDDLHGLAMFVGINHSFAVSAGGGGVVPNSIYFTDAKRLSRLDGRDDIGIFDYEKKTISNILDVQGNRIHSSLGWFKP